MDISDCGEKVKQLIEEHLAAVGINVVHESIDILSNRFEKQIEETKTPEGKAAEMEHAIRHEIRVKLEENPVYYTSLKERLEELLQRRKDRQMNIDELFAEYRNMVNDMRNTAQKVKNKALPVNNIHFIKCWRKKCRNMMKQRI